MRFHKNFRQKKASTPNTNLFRYKKRTKNKIFIAEKNASLSGVKKALPAFSLVSLGVRMNPKYFTAMKYILC